MAKNIRAKRLHESAINSIIAGNPAIQRNGFWIAMRALWARIGAGRDGDTLEQRTFIPDAFLIDEPGERIILFEIEDTHPMPHFKRALIGRFWFAWDCVGIEGWDVEVAIVNRFGMLTHTLLGVHLWLEGVAQAVIDERSDTPSSICSPCVHAESTA